MLRLGRACRHVEEQSHDEHYLQFAHDIPRNMAPQEGNRPEDRRLIMFLSAPQYLRLGVNSCWLAHRSGFGTLEQRMPLMGNGWKLEIGTLFPIEQFKRESPRMDRCTPQVVECTDIVPVLDLSLRPNNGYIP